MRWNDIKRGHKFKDGSKTTQRHQIHDYECYELTYEDDNGNVRTLVASKDHLLMIDISTWPEEAKAYVIKYCSNGKIPLHEDITCEILGYVTDDQKKLIYNYVLGNIDASYFAQLEDISEDHFECYLMTFKDGTYREVFVNRFTVDEESQRIDDARFWIPVEGLNWLINTFGELDIGSNNN